MAHVQHPTIAPELDHLQSGVENILINVLNVLNNAEQEYRATNTDWKKKLKEFETWKKTLSKKPAPSLSRVHQPGMTKADMVREVAEQEQSPFATFNPNQPINEFSFADMTKISQEELEELLSSLKAAVKRPFIDGLRRGLGVHGHHA